VKRFIGLQRGINEIADRTACFQHRAVP